MKRILVTGINGQLGQELLHLLAKANYRDVNAVGREALDLSQPSKISQVIAEFRPDIVINTAAYTAVDQAESDREVAETVNGIAPGIMAKEAQRMGAVLIHISTDYVFDGCQSHPYLETDTTNPLNVYGQSKLAGEQAIRESCNSHLIIRTAWVYGVGGKGNFVKTMLKLGAERDELRVVADQVGSPTSTRDLASVLTQLLPQLSLEIAGTYHYTNSGVASWYDFAVAIFEEAKQLGFPLKVQRVIPITTSEYPTPALRPAYSVLNCGKIAGVLATYAPHWRQGLRQMLVQYIAEKQKA